MRNGKIRKNYARLNVGNSRLVGFVELSEAEVTLEEENSYRKEK